MTNVVLKNSLVELGLTIAEAEVYLSLLSLSVATTGPIITKTGLHRNVVYTALDHLVSLKLISVEQIRGKKSFSVIDPSTFAAHFKELSDLADTVAQAVKASGRKIPQEVTTHGGNEEYLALLIGLIKQLPRGGTKYVLGTGGESFMRETMRPIWKKYHQVARAQGINIRMIAYESQRNALEKDISDESLYEVRYLSDDSENPSGMHIYPEAKTVLNIIYSDDAQPVTAISIKDERLVKGELNLFNNLWKIAKS